MMNVKILLRQYWSWMMIFSMTVLFLPSHSLANPEMGDQDKIKLDEAFHRIGEQFDVFFNYDQSLTSNIMVEYKETKNKSLNVVLSDLLKNTHLEYQIFGDQFVVIFQNSKAGIENLKNMITHVQGFVDEHEERSRNHRPVSILEPVAIQKLEEKRSCSISAEQLQMKKDIH